jgi:hypothetical protein
MATFSLATLRQGADLMPAVGVGAWYLPLAVARAFGHAGLDTDVKSLFADWRAQFPRLQSFADECAMGGASRLGKIFAYKFTVQIQKFVFLLFGDHELNSNGGVELSDA